MSEAMIDGVIFLFLIDALLIIKYVYIPDKYFLKKIPYNKTKEIFELVHGLVGCWYYYTTLCLP